MAKSNKKRKMIVGLTAFLVVCSSFFVFASRIDFSQAADPPASGDTTTGTSVAEQKASNTSNVPTSVVGFVVYGLLVIVGGIVDFLVFMAAKLADWALFFDNIAKADVVIVGWQITRSVVNFIFALALLIMAFSTILNIGAYNAKKMLPKLIVVALSINFSLFICGAIIDFSQVISSYFLNNAVTPGKSISEDLMKGLQLQTVEKTDLSNRDSGKSWWAKFVEDFKIAQAANSWGVVGPPLRLIVNKFFSIIVTSIAFVVFLFLFLIFVVRVIILWIVLILAPLAWVFYLVPGGAGLTTKWRTAFLKWTFTAPAATFFVFLALRVARNTDKIGVTSNQSLTGLSQYISDFLVPSILMSYIAIIGLLFMAVVVGSKLEFVGKGAYNATLGFARKRLDERRQLAGNKMLQSDNKLVRMGGSMFRPETIGAGRLARTQEAIKKGGEGAMQKKFEMLDSSARARKRAEQAGALTETERRRQTDVAKEMETLKKIGDPDHSENILKNAKSTATQKEAAIRHLMETKSYTKLKDSLGAENTSPQALMKAIDVRLRSDKAGERYSGQTLRDLQIAAVNNGEYQFAGSTAYDARRKAFVVNPDSAKQQEAAVNKFAAQKPKEAINKLSIDQLAAQGKGGQYSLTGSGKEILTQIANSQAHQNFVTANNMSPRFVEEIGKLTRQLRESNKIEGKELAVLEKMAKPPTAQKSGGAAGGGTTT